MRTGDSGQADLQFNDRSNLSVGPNSTVQLDKFVYDPNKSAGTVAVEATRGSFRFVTGSQGRGAIRSKLRMALLAYEVEEFVVCDAELLISQVFRRFRSDLHVDFAAVE